MCNEVTVPFTDPDTVGSRNFGANPNKGGLGQHPDLCFGLGRFLPSLREANRQHFLQEKVLGYR
jgi:hypothetical protein